MTGLRVALRIAWRDALRHKGRSLLVVAMVGLPVLGLTTADVLVRTAQLSPSEQATRELGTADAQIEAPSGTPSAAAVLTALGPGSTLTTRATGSVVVRTPDGLSEVPLTQVDLSSPLTQGLYRLRSGRVPASASEVLVSSSLARSEHLHVGGTWTLSDPKVTLTVVGTFLVPSSTHEDLALARPGAVLPTSGAVSTTTFGAVPATDLEYLVDTPRPQSSLEALFPDTGGTGVGVTTRYDVEHPAPEPSGLHSQRAVVTVVATGLGILQVVLLAGAAFAVGARRQVRDLALVSAAGGERRHIASVVLAGGLLAGVVGGVGGVALGVPLAAVLLPTFERFGDTLAGHFDVRPLEIALGTVIGVVAGVASALLPARAAARQDTVQALSGRRGSRGTDRRLTLGGLAAIVLGALVTVKGAASPANATEVLGGSVVAELGFIACAPALIGLAARGARVLPVSGRMALRDAARHRARSGPAVAAVMAALAGAIAISTYLVSSSAYDRQTYHGSDRTGQATIYESSGAKPLPATLVASITAALPTRSAVQLPSLQEPCSAAAQAADGPGCPTPYADVPFSPRDGSTEVTVGDAATVRALLGGRDDPAADAALAAGRVLVLSHGFAAGPVRVVDDGTPNGDERTLGTVTGVPFDIGVANIPYSYPGLVVSAATAQRLGLTQAPGRLLVDTTRMPTKDETAKVNLLLADAGYGQVFQVEQGYQGGSSLVQLVLAGVAALVTIAAVAIATGLAAAEGRADLATLAAVGATPGLRRRLAMAQASVVALLGAGLGVLSGLVPAVAVVHARAGWPLVLPWTVIAIAVLGVPVLAAGLAGVVTRSRLPLVARAT